MIGRSGEKVGRIDIQVWEKKTVAVGLQGGRRGRLLEGLSWWQIIFVLLSTLFWLQNLPVSFLFLWHSLLLRSSIQGAREWMQGMTGMDDVAGFELDTL
jgi:hypothetical protein